MTDLQKPNFNITQKEKDISWYQGVISKTYHPHWCGIEDCLICQLAEGSPKEANPHCPACHGAGFLHPEGDYSKTITCEYCNDPLKTKALLAKREMSFENFSIMRNGRKEPELENAKKKAQEFALFKGKPMLLLYGGSGVGKTHLCTAIKDTILSKHLSVYSEIASRLLDWLKAGFEDKEYPTEERMQFLREVFCLIIDDFKNEYTSNWGYDRLESIIDYRYSNLMLTVLTTNNDINAGEFPFRIKDRFEDNKLSEIVLIDIPSYRPLRK